MISGKQEELKQLNETEYRELKKIMKKYTNLYKALYLFDPSLSAEFKTKNEFYMNEKLKKSKKSHQHIDSQSSCCSGKFNNKSISNFLPFFLPFKTRGFRFNL